MYQSSTAWYLAAAKLRDIQVRDPPSFAVFHPTADRLFDQTLPKPEQCALSLIKLQLARYRDIARAIFLHARWTTKSKMKQADRPDSVTAGEVNFSAMTTIPLGRELLHGSSFLPARSASSLNACLFGIAPSGGYRVSPFVTQGAACALPGPKDSSLWPCSSPYTLRLSADGR
jgi:hypothetical protein